MAARESEDVRHHRLLRRRAAPDRVPESPIQTTGRKTGRFSTRRAGRGAGLPDGEALRAQGRHAGLGECEHDGHPRRRRPTGRTVATIEDITERKAAEERIRAQAELLDLAQDAIAVEDMTGRVQYSATIHTI